MNNNQNSSRLQADVRIFTIFLQLLVLLSQAVNKAEIRIGKSGTGTEKLEIRTQELMELYGRSGPCPYEKEESKFMKNSIEL